MDFIKRIHPSAALFVGVLIAFTLPFGYSAESCGPSTKEYRGVELLVAHVEPDGSSQEAKDYARGTAGRGVVFGWALFVAAAVGLWRTIRRDGRLWATWCAITAVLALLVGGIVIDAGEVDAGWLLALSLPTGGVALKILISFGRWIWGLRERRFAPAVTTPHEPAVR